MKVIAGEITFSGQMYEQVREDERNWKQLEWTATHYDEATPEQRAHLDRVLEAIDRMEDDE